MISCQKNGRKRLKHKSLKAAVLHTVISVVANYNIQDYQCNSREVNIRGLQGDHRLNRMALEWAMGQSDMQAHNQPRPL